MSETKKPSPGELYHPFAADQLENPYPLYQSLRRDEPIAYNPRLQAWVVSKYSDLRSIASQPESFSSREVSNPLDVLSPAVRQILLEGYPVLPTSMNSDGVTHQRFREPHRQALSSVRMQQYDSYIRLLANSLVDSFIEDQEGDLIEQFTSPLPFKVILHVLGIPEADMSKLKQWSEDQVSLFDESLSEEAKIECARNVVAYRHYLAAYISRRSRDPGDDLIGVHITHEIPGTEPLSLAELVSLVAELTTIGHQTTADLIGNTFFLLLQDRSRWEQLCLEPALIPSAVEESLRYESPIPCLYRTTTREVTIDHITMPAGAKVLLLFASANRDEAFFSFAETFQLARNPNRHLAFGFGVHSCPGAPLARLEARIALEVVCKRLPTLHLLPDQSFAHLPALTLRGLQRLKVRWEDQKESANR